MNGSKRLAEPGETPGCRIRVDAERAGSVAEHSEQPSPIPRTGVPSVQAAVRADLQLREQVGIERYGTPLQPHNGRDALRDAYEEPWQPEHALGAPELP